MIEVVTFKKFWDLNLQNLQKKLKFGLKKFCESHLWKNEETLEKLK